MLLRTHHKGNSITQTLIKHYENKKEMDNNDGSIARHCYRWSIYARRF